MPPFISQIVNIIETLTSWIKYLIPAILTAVVTINGIKAFASGDDQKKEKAKSEAIKAIGIAVLVLLGGSIIQAVLGLV